MKRIIAVVGPTASGKTALAHALALKLDTELLSADSRLVYRGLDIGTAKPEAQLLQERRYYLIDVTEPAERELSLGDYLELAQPILQEHLEANKPLIVVGGTGFYLRGLLEGLQLSEVAPDPAFRASLSEFTTTQLHQRLPTEQRSRIHPNDRVRIIRALEIQHYGQPASAERLPAPEVCWLGLNFANRELLRARIRERTAAMLQAGLLAETEALLNRYGELNLFHKTIGYHEAIQYLQGELNGLDMLQERIAIATSQYAKRQMTWFRANPKIHWLEASQPFDELLQQALQVIVDEENGN